MRLFGKSWGRWAMRSEWRATTVGAISLVVTKGTTPTTLGHAFQDSGINFVKVESMSSSGRFLSDKLVRISPEAHEALARSKLALNDILFTIAGTIGRTAIVTDDILPANTNQAVAIVRPNPALVLPRFLRYVLANPAFLNGALSRTVESVQANFSLGELKGATIRVPELGEQEAIADVLGSLDDRIDLLRQTNATLESIAQALFKSWFIDFDPVRAKTEGREPDGMDVATAALFPAEFEESTLGLIPQGWRTSTVAEALEFNPSRPLSKGVDARYLEMANAPTAGHRPLHSVERRAFGSGCKFRNGDALLAKITPCIENGKSAFVDFLTEGEVGWGSTEFIVLRAKPVLPQYGAYLLARYEPFRHFAIQAMTGTSGRQRVDLSRLTQFPVALPPDSSIAAAVEPTLNALQLRIAANDEQAKSLAALRDSLLPRLISGKLRLPEAKAQLEEAIA